MNKRFLFIQERFKKVSKIARKEKILKDNEEFLRNKKEVVPIDEPVGLTYFDEYSFYGEQGVVEDDEVELNTDETYIVEETRKLKAVFEIQSGVPP